MTKSRARARIAKVSAVGVLAAAATVGLAPLAFAGASSTTNGCYSTWGNTGSDAHCNNPNATQDGNYGNYESCSAESDNQTWVWFGAGSVSNDWGQEDCTWSANWSAVRFTS
ncbi:hypothetical protein [Kitasatospora sp. NPDC056531]|uniref:hypothetical protein n=1 Tax=Kitasatospora sp. NPDC056531 TaxID=3345856 RepID=UPI00369D19E0